MMIATVRGTLGPVTGTVEYDGTNVRSVKADVTIDVKAIDTGNASRDPDLRARGFLRRREIPRHDVQIEAGGGGRAGTVPAGRRPHDPRRHQRGHARRRGAFARHQTGKDLRVGASATTKLNRRDFGLNYNGIIEAGAVVGDEITVTIDIEIMKPAR